MKLSKLLNKKTKSAIVGVLMAMTAAGCDLDRVNNFVSARNEGPKETVEHLVRVEISKENEEKLRNLLDFLNDRNEEEIKIARNMLEEKMDEVIRLSRQNPDTMREILDRLYEVYGVLMRDSSHSNFQSISHQALNVLREQLEILNIKEEELDNNPLIGLIGFLVLFLIVGLAMLYSIKSEERRLGKGNYKVSNYM